MFRIVLTKIWVFVSENNNERDETVREEFERRFRAEIKDMTKRGAHSRCVYQWLFVSYLSKHLLWLKI